MAKRTTRSKTRTTLAATALLVLFAIVIPWGPGLLFGCELDTSPKILRHPPVKRAPADDNDSGGNDQ